MNLAKVTQELNKRKDRTEMSYQDIADVTGCHRNTVSNLLTERKGNSTTLFSVARALGMILTIKVKGE